MHYTNILNYKTPLELTERDNKLSPLVQTHEEEKQIVGASRSEPHTCGEPVRVNICIDVWYVRHTHSAARTKYIVGRPLNISRGTDRMLFLLAPLRKRAAYIATCSGYVFVLSVRLKQACLKFGKR